MKTDTGGVLLVLVGGVVLQVTLSGQFQNYVRTGLGPWLLVVAAALVVAGCVRVVQRLREPDDEHPPRPRGGPRLHTHGPLAVAPEVVARARRQERRQRPQHDHSRVPPAAWLLCVPIFLLLVVPPPALGAFAAARGDGVIPEPVSAFPPLPVGRPLPMGVRDYAQRAAWDDGRTLIDREVVLTGFVTPTTDGGWSVTRTVLTCCAADARSFPVRVVGDPAPRTPDTWVQVTGRFVPAGDPARRTAAILAHDVRPVAEPAQSYEE